LRAGWEQAAIFSAEKTQRGALGLRDHELAPCQLCEEIFAGVTRFWFVDVRGSISSVGERRRHCGYYKAMGFRLLNPIRSARLTLH
jgi:hypothetical protein